MRQVNGAMKSAREMEGSVSVSAYMRATTGKRLDPLLLPSSRPHVPPRNIRPETWTFTNYALPVTHEAIALSDVSRSLKKKRKRAPLARGACSPAPETAAGESSREMVLGVREKDQVHSRSQQTSRRQQELGSTRLLVLPDVGRLALR